MARTREEMVDILRAGGSVMHGSGLQSRIISREEDLPTETDLASGDREKLIAAREGLVHRRDRIEAEIAAVDSELATLGTAPKPSKSSAKKSSKDEAAAASDGQSDPSEAGEENTRSQATATIGTAQSDAQGAPEQAQVPS